MLGESGICLMYNIELCTLTAPLHVSNLTIMDGI
nr:MAG TPA: ribosomal protein [Caudoviricetes sp.]